MKAESTTLAGQRENNKSWEEKEMADTDLEFSFRFSFVFLTCWFAGFIFWGSFLLWDSFSMPTPKWKLQPLVILTMPDLAFIWLSLPHCVWLPTNFQSRVDSILPPGGERRNVTVSASYTAVQNIWDLLFFRVFLITVVVSPVTSWPKTRAWAWVTHRSAGRFRRLYVCFFLYFLSLSFPIN